MLIVLGSLSLSAQNLTGKVTEYDSEGQEKPATGAILQWKNTDIGTYTDTAGKYNLERTPLTDTLLVIYQAYDNDTIKVSSSQTELDIVLSAAHGLAAVDVSAHSGAYVSIKPILTTVITSQGLRKAACCNLGESFENTVAVDVSYADAVTGSKQISMLGLAGIFGFRYILR